MTTLFRLNVDGERVPLSDEDAAQFEIDAAADALIPVPEVVSAFQAKAALLGAGLLPTVNAMIAGSNDPFLQLAWDKASEFRRHSPFVTAIGAEPALGLIDAAIDDLFRAAALIFA